MFALYSRYDNVMIWQSPPWSQATLQFTHGFPRRLVAESHCGFLPGNVTVTAKATNLTLKRLAVCDVACLVSRGTTAGSGLGRARLLNLRYAAVSYHRGSYFPQYLACAMVEYGVNFATFEPLSSAALDALSNSITKGWQEQPGEEDDSSGSESSETEPLIAYSFTESVLREIGKRSTARQCTTEAGESSSDQALSAEESAALCTLLAQISRSQADDSLSSDSEDERVGSSQAQEARQWAASSSRRAGTEGAGSRRRKRKSASSALTSAASKSARAANVDDSQLTRTGTEFILSFIAVSAFLQNNTNTKLINLYGNCKTA